MKMMWAFLVLLGANAVAGQVEPEPDLRYPVALASADDHLFVANERSGSISVVRFGDHKLVKETRLANRLSDLAVVPGRPRLLALDPQQNAVLLLERNGSELRELTRTTVAPVPVQICVAEDGTWCSVGSLWGRRLTWMNLRDGLEVIRTVDLPFAPRSQYLIDARHLVVADAFGGQLAVVEVPSGRVIGVRTIEGHNIRGLTLSADQRRLFVVHQMLDPQVPTVRERIFWGQLIGNMVREIELDELIDPASRRKRIAHWALHPLGEATRGSGDPTAIVVGRNGLAAVALGGVNEVLITDFGRVRSRVRVGTRPIALAMDASERWLYVANSFDDSIAVVNIASARVEETIRLGPMRERSLAEQGELHFYDARLSLDGWFSCHSCHTDGHANEALNDNFSDGTFGAPKRVLSLLGVAGTGPWAWNGSRTNLADQVRRSILETMRGEPNQADDEVVAALVAFMQTLPPAQAVGHARREIDSSAVERGRQIFAKHDCARCHRPPMYTVSSTHDVGLEDENGDRRFNPPSLIGVSQRDRLFHDGRARSLEDIFTRFRHPDDEAIGHDEIADLVEFLRTL